MLETTEPQAPVPQQHLIQGGTEPAAPQRATRKRKVDQDFVNDIVAAFGRLTPKGLRMLADTMKDGKSVDADSLKTYNGFFNAY